MTNALVSIVIPAFNSGLYIKKCLYSALAQTHKNLEIIVIDDGSEDDTLQICSEISDARLVIYSQSNSGVSVARNNGIKRATGEYVFFLDADDTLECDCIENLLALIKSNDCDIVCGSHRLIKTRNRNLNQRYINEVIFINSESDVLDLLGKITNAPWAKLYKKEIIKEVKFPVDVRLAEDSIFLTKILGRTKSICLTDIIVYNYSFFENGSAVNKFYPDFFEYMMLWKKEMIAVSIERGMRYSTEKIDEFLFTLCMDHYIKNKNIKALKEISELFGIKNVCNKVAKFCRDNIINILKYWLKKDFKL